jgi:hypothetical protein
LLLTVAALACLGYAAWAMTARRGIFADFADNRPVSLDHARSSDRTDTIFLVVAGALAVVALAFWLLRLASGKARSGGLAVVGFAMSVLGIACVVVGLVLSGMVGTGGSRADEGNKAATATIVTGSGFIAGDRPAGREGSSRGRCQPGSGKYVGSNPGLVTCGALAGRAPSTVVGRAVVHPMMG